MFGSLAPDGAVVKKSAVAKQMLVHKGPARVFDGEDQAMKAIFGGEIKKGDVVVIPVSYTHLDVYKRQILAYSLLKMLKNNCVSILVLFLCDSTENFSLKTAKHLVYIGLRGDDFLCYNIV